MKAQTFALEIVQWEDGPAFRPALRRGRRANAPKRELSVDMGLDGFSVGKLPELKPVGFYVAYSYTLFRKGTGPRDSLYSLF